MTLTSTISGTHTAAITLTSATYANPVTVTGAIAGIFTSYAWSIANSGTIQGAVDGINFLNNGAVGTISNAGRITGTSHGIRLNGAARSRTNPAATSAEPALPASMSSIIRVRPRR